jgi:hypothetical protein
MQLAATQVQDKRQADKRCVKGHLYVHYNYIFHHWQVHILDHADYSADGPWIFGLENALVLWMTKPHGSKFARASSQLHAKCKATSFLQARFENNF